MDAEPYARMPERRTTRETEIGGAVLVTTLADAKMVSATKIDTWYGWRWQVEIDLHTIKAKMGIEVMRTQTYAMIDKEIAVYLLAYNLICTLMVRVATCVGLKARLRRFKGGMQLYLAFEQQLRFTAGVCISVMTAHLLGGVSMLRPPMLSGCSEPYAIKRRLKTIAFSLCREMSLVQLLVTLGTKQAKGSAMGGLPLSMGPINRQPGHLDQRGRFRPTFRGVQPLRYSSYLHLSGP